MKLPTWVKEIGIMYNTAWRMYKTGDIPYPTKQLMTGTIIVYTNQRHEQIHSVIFARILCHDQKPELDRQVIRLRDYCVQHGLTITKEITEIVGFKWQTTKIMVVSQ